MTAPAAGTAAAVWVSVLPDLGNFGRDLINQLGRAGQQGGQAAGEQAESALSKAAKGIAAAGAVAGAALGVALVGAMNVEAANDKLAAQLGLTGKEAERYGRLAGDLYAANYGDSLEMVNEALRQVTLNVGATATGSDQELQRITASVLDVATAFDQDLGGVAVAVGQLLKTGLAPDATAALDLITVGFQAGADKAGDFLDTLNEYGVQFQKFGLDGAAATGLLSQGLQGGARDADLVADAIKEFSIRAVDGSTTSAEGFAALGLSAEAMTAVFARGGPEAAAGLDTVIDGLNSMTDPVARNAAGVALFGTQFEDLGPAFAALDPSSAVASLGQIGGAAADMGATLADNAGANLEMFKRQAMTAFIDIVGGKILPIVTTVAAFLAASFGPALAAVGGFLTGTVVPGFMAFVGWLRDSQAWLLPLAAGVGTVALALSAATIATTAWGLATSGAAAIMAIARGAVLSFQVGVWLLNAAMAANPIGIVVALIAGLVAALVVAYNTSETFRNIVDAAFRVVGDVVASVIGFFTNLPTSISTILTGLGPMIANAATTAWAWLVSSAQTAGAAVLDFLANLPQNIAYALGFLAGTIYRAAVDGWNGLSTALVDAWAGTVAFVQSIPQRTADALSSLGSFLATTAANGWAGFTGGITDAWNGTVAFVASIPGLIMSALAGLGASLTTSAATGWAGFTAGISTGWAATVAFLTGLPAAIVGFFAAAPQWLLTVGQDIIGGLVNGLVGAATAVGNFFTGLVDSFLAGFRSALGIASPSTVFAQMGVDILTGLLEGLRSLVGVLLEFFQGFVTGIVSVFSTALGFLTGLWSAFWTGLSAVAQTLFDGIRVVIELTWTVIRGLFLAAIALLTGNWDGFWRILQATATSVFAQIRAVIDGAWAAIRGAFDSAISFLRGLWDQWWAGLRSVADAVFGGIRSFIDIGWTAIRGFFTSGTSAISGMWSGFWSGLSTVTSTVFGAIRGTIDTVIAGITTAFRTVVSSITTIWGGIRAALARPVNFMINTVYNNGIVRAWNFVAGLIPGIGPIGTIAGIPEFAKGGPVMEDTLLRAGEAGPEYILSADAVAGLGGIDAVDRLHRRAVREPIELSTLNSGRFVEGADHNGPGTSTVGFGGVKPHVAQAGHYLKNRFGIASVGGVGQRANASDHPKGLALDFMTYSDTAKGDRLVNYLLPNAGHFAVKYIIWKQRINSGSGWRGMEDRGSVTANHFDHPHVSFLDGPGGGGFSGAGGEFLNPLPGLVRTFFDTFVNPLVAAIPGGPPRFLDIPKGAVGFARDSALKFFLGLVGGDTAFDRGGVAVGKGLLMKDVIEPERVLSPRETVAFEQLVASLPTAPTTSLPAPGTPSELAPGGPLDRRLGELIEAVRAQPRVPNMTVQTVRDPVEAARAIQLALRP